MDDKYEVRKYKCSICGKTTKIVTPKGTDKDTYPMNAFFKMASTGDLVCKACEREYHVLGNYNYRGYGYKFSTEPNFTSMDKKSETPTFGVEIEVAGNIKNIEKIKLLTEKTQECSIGYDTSVAGAMFELSYAPGTYYWYLYESHLRNVCRLLQKDPWVKESETIGTHIHFGNIDTSSFYKSLINAANKDINFWPIMRIIAEREFNQYCRTDFTMDHHDAISYNMKWRTIEFRMFAGTYSAEKILMRMKFIRQIYNNITPDEGIMWHNFSQESKTWFKTLLNKTRKYNKEIKADIWNMFEKETNKTESPTQHDISNRIRDRLNSSVLWYEEVYEDENEYEYEEE